MKVKTGHLYTHINTGSVYKIVKKNHNTCDIMVVKSNHRLDDGREGVVYQVTYEIFDYYKPYGFINFVSLWKELNL